MRQVGIKRASAQSGVNDSSVMEPKSHGARLTCVVADDDVVDVQQGAVVGAEVKGEGGRLR